MQPGREAEVGMMAQPSSKANARLLPHGFSLVEILVALTVMGVVGLLLMPLMLGARTMVEADQLRTATNQGVRAGAELIGSDIRMAGERFPRGGALALSPVQIVPGGSSPDEITLRRNLWEGTLPVCEASVDDSDVSIQVVRLAGDAFWTPSNLADYPECGQPIDPGSGWPKNLHEVDALADSTTPTGVLRAYILDPATGVGEFLDFEVHSDAHTTGVIHRVGSAPIVNTYPLANKPLIYVLEERHYRLRSGILELVRNGQTATPLRVTAGITGLVTRYVLPDGSVVSALASGTTWRDIRSVQVMLTGTAAVGPDSTVRSLTARYFPRNVLSR
jgi:prepilin-type N-terminal cleavage/methylation domain-containing protein